MVKNGADFEYQYTLKDHLGNTRVMFGDANGDGTAEIVQETHYYPFGLQLAGLGSSGGTPENKFLYNGKELEDDHNLYWYHYGARYYDPQLGRWHSIDPADEFYSPYVYVGNSPTIATDTDGKRTWLVHGTFSGTDTWGKSELAWGKALNDEATLFSWSGNNYNGSSNQGHKGRFEAALMLANDIVSFVENNPGEKVNIVGHSHGGNVGILAANLVSIMAENIIIDNLIVIGTPSRDDFRLTGGNVDNFVGIYNNFDIVQKFGGTDFALGTGADHFGLAGRTHPGANNVNISPYIRDSQNYGNTQARTGLRSVDSFKAHTQLHTDPYVINAATQNVEDN